MDLHNQVGSMVEKIVADVQGSHQLKTSVTEGEGVNQKSRLPTSA